MATSLTAAIDGLEDLLIASTTFKSSFDLSSEQAIRDQRIMLEAITDENDNLLSELPAAAILEDDHRYSLIAHGPGLELAAAGSVMLLMAKNVTFSDNDKKSRHDFTEWSSQIVDEIVALIAEGNHYPFSSVSLGQRAVRPPRKKRTQDFWWCSYRFGFSIDE